MTPKKEAEGNVSLCEAQCIVKSVVSTGKPKCHDGSHSKYHFAGMVIA